MSNDALGMPCLVCGGQLQVRVATGRKSGKPFLMVICPANGSHFRGFVGYRPYVDSVLAHLEGQTPTLHPSGEVDDSPTPDNPSKTKLEGRSDG